MTMCMSVANIEIIPSMAADYHSILILGGTKEAAKLAQTLQDRGHKVITSLAGRTKEPKPIAGKTRKGGFNAKAASVQAGVPLVQYQRPLWAREQGDQWQEVATLDTAKNAIPTKATVLLALGRQHIAPFAEREDVHFIIRMVDAPETPLAFKRHTLLLGKPKATAAAEEALFTKHKITHIVCRNSGGTGAYAKIEAARNLGIPVIILTR